MNYFYRKWKLQVFCFLLTTYVLGSSIAEKLDPSVTSVFQATLLLLTIIGIKKNGVYQEIGLISPVCSLTKLYYYIPLGMVTSFNIWSGIHFDVHISLIVSMICAGAIEELLFRGILFDYLNDFSNKIAVTVSTIVFTIAHMFNSQCLNVLQITSIASIGFLFAVLRDKSKSIIPGIVSHCLFNVLWVFAAGTAIAYQYIILIIISVSYAWFIMNHL